MSLHLHTHNPNRPPPQILCNPKHSPLANSNLPPRLILRILHLRYMHKTVMDRTKSLLSSQALTDLLTARFMSPEFPSDTWPALRPAWLGEQRAHPSLARQAHAVAAKMLTVLTDSKDKNHKSSPDRHAHLRRLHRRQAAMTARQREVHADPSQLALLCYLRLRAKRIGRAQDEADWFRERAGALRRAAAERGRAWAHRRDERRSARRTVWHVRARYEAYRAGLAMPWEWDARGWGVELRLGTLRGEVGKRWWPAQEHFEMYKWVRYGWKGEARNRARGGWERKTVAYGSGLMLRGGSPLKEEWIIR